MALSKKTTLAAVACAAFIGLAGCSGQDANGEAGYTEEPVETLYNTAMSSLEQGEFDAASTQFDEVERQHPYSTWAIKSQVMAAYSLYMANKYDEAVVALDRFIQLHPSNKDVAYAFYLKGLCYYEQISDVGRDQVMTQLALKTFNELLTRFPDSEFSRDAKLKIDLTYDHLAGKEMNIGRYYQSRKQWLAAINRFNSVVDKYQTTTHAPEALHRLVESYLALGLREEAKKHAAVLGHNFPGSKWYVETYRLLGDPNFGAPQDQEPWYKIW